MCLLSEQVLLREQGGNFKTFLKRAGSIKRAGWNFHDDSKIEQGRIFLFLGQNKRDSYKSVNHQDALCLMTK